MRKHLLAVGLLIGLALNSEALIVAGSSPAEPFITRYVGSVSDASGVYLGKVNGANWVLTAAHIDNLTTAKFTSGGVTYDQVGTGTFLTELDLYLFRIDVDEGAPLAAYAPLALNGSVLSDESEVVLSGYGGAVRSTEFTFWDTTTNPWTVLPDPSEANAFGYTYTPSSLALSWGVATSERATLGGLDRIGAQFVPVSGSPMGVRGDSGGGMFYYDEGLGQWTLAALMQAVTSMPNQPSDTAVFGNYTVGLDVSSYKSQIEAAMIPEGETFWLALLGLGGIAAFRLRQSRRRMG